MNPRLLEVLKKAKAVDQRAEQIGTNVSTKTTPSLSDSMSQKTNNMMSEQPTPTMELPTNRPQPKVNVNSSVYKDRVMESGLPPEIMKAMLDNPIEQPDALGTFSMNEEAIKEVNPSYGKPVSNTITKAPIPPTSNKASLNVNNGEIRKMIAEEIAKALPSIVEKYFDKKMIRENIEVLKALKVKKKTTNNRK